MRLSPNSRKEHTLMYVQLKALNILRIASYPLTVAYDPIRGYEVICFHKKDKLEGNRWLSDLSLEMGIKEAWKWLKENGGKWRKIKNKNNHDERIDIVAGPAMLATTDKLISEGFFDD